MSILLLAECWPYRNSPKSFDTSQGRLLAGACGLTIQQLQTLCNCQYVINTYVPSCRRNKDYESKLRYKIEHEISSIIMEHDLAILIGKRLMHIMSPHHVDFFKEYFTYSLDNDKVEMTVACIPNPMADFWWKEITSCEKVKVFMSRAFEVYGG